MSRVAVCTLVRDRRAHLESLIHGLLGQTRLPDELVIAYLQEAPFDGLPVVPFPIRQVMVPGQALPLATARNACAGLATSELLIFLDVDCTPGPSLVAGFIDALRTTDPGTDRCVMGDVRYAAQDDPSPVRDFQSAWRTAVEHPARAFRERHGAGTHDLADPGAFWSLCFALSNAAFRRTGGFDADYVGYGGEDTDFGLALQTAGVGLAWCDNARAIHRWHPVQIPPLDHLASIVRNAERFRRRHGTLCMDYWLDQFIADDYVERTANGGVRVRRYPTADECELARQPGHVRFS